VSTGYFVDEAARTKVRAASLCVQVNCRAAYLTNLRRPRARRVAEPSHVVHLRGV